MKAKAAVALLLVAALGIGGWCVMRPRPAPPIMAKVLLGIGTEPAPVASGDLLQLRKPLADSVVYPGIKLGDSFSDVWNLLHQKSIQFTGFHFPPGRSERGLYAVWGSVFSETPATSVTVDVAFFNKRLYNAVLTIGGQKEADARRLCDAWIAAINRWTNSKGSSVDVVLKPTEAKAIRWTVWWDKNTMVSVMCSEDFHTTMGDTSLQIFAMGIYKGKSASH